MIEDSFINRISAKEFAEKYRDNQFDGLVEIVDVREIEEWRSRHLKKSILIPLGELADRINEINREATVYLICAHGVRSLYATQFLREQGFSQVVNVDGGLAEVALYLEEEDVD